MDKSGKFFKAMEDKISSRIDKKGRFYFNVKNEDLREIVDYLFKTMRCRLSTATGMEMYHGLEILYHFSDDDTGTYFCPRVIIKDKEHPKVKSIVPIVKGAEWIERELFDFWGIEFEDHPRMERLLALHHPQNLKEPYRFGRSCIGNSCSGESCGLKEPYRFGRES